MDGTRLEHWFGLWPSWSNRWIGWLARIVLLAAVALFALVMLLLVQFGVYGWGSEADWDGEVTAITLAGLAVVASGLWMVFRPSRAGLSSTLVSVLALLVVGSVV